MRRPEDRLQAQVIEFLRLSLPRHVVFAVPNGGTRNVREAVNLKRCGVLAGMPDVGILGDEGRSWWIELKSATGRLSKPQRAMLDTLRVMGVPVGLARSLEDVQALLTTWGLGRGLLRNQTK